MRCFAFFPTFFVSLAIGDKQMGLPQPVTLSIGGVIQTPEYCSVTHLKIMIDYRFKYIDIQLGLLTIEGTTFNEESILFSVEKLNNFSQLAVLAHQLLVFSLSRARYVGEVILAA